MSKRSHQDDADDLPPQATGIPSPNVGNSNGHGHGNANGNPTPAPGAGHLATLQAALGDRPAPRKRSNPGPRPDLATLLPTLPASPALPMGGHIAGALGSPSITSPGILSPSHPHQQQQHTWGPVTANLVDSLTNSTANLSVRSRGSSMSNGVPPFLGHHVPSPADLSRALSQLPEYHQGQQPLHQPMPLQMQFQPAPPSLQQQHPHHQQQQISPQPFDFVQQQFFGGSGNGDGNQLTIDTHAASQYAGPSSFTAPHLRGLSANSATSAASPTTARTPESLTGAATPTSATTPTLPHLSGDTHPSGPSSAGSNNGSSSSVAVPKRRPRATPDQLKLLEETFLQTTSPNAQLRADLANRLSMTERSVQIWFQNKRAKVKNAQRKSQQEIQETAARTQMAAAYGVAAMGGPGAAAAMGWHSANGSASPMGSPFVHAPGIASPAGALDAGSAGAGGLAGPMELLGSYLFSVDSLTVGTWRRAAQYSARSLFCAYALSHQLFTWTITDNNYTFKMEMPFQHVSQLVMQCVPPPPPPTPPSVPVSPTTEGMAAQVAAAAAAQSQPQAELVITLSQAPMFWMQVDTPTGKLWTQCNDFTENRQADTHLVHKLRGPPDALRAQVASLISSDAALRERSSVEDPNQPGTMYSGDQALQVLPALMPGIAPASAVQQQQQQQQHQGPQAIAARPPGVAQHAQHPAVRTLVNRPRRSASAPMPPSFRSSPSAPSPLGGPALMPGLEHLSQQQQQQHQQQQMHMHQPFQHHQQAGMLQQDQRTFTAPHLRNQSQPNQYMSGTADPSVFHVPANAPPMPNASLAMAPPYNMMDLSQLSNTSASAPSSQQDFTSSSASMSASGSPLVVTNRPGRSNSDPAHVNLAAIHPPPPMPMAPAAGGDLFGDVFGMSAPMDHSQLAMYSFGNAAAAEGCDPSHAGGQQQQQHQAQQMMMMAQQQQPQEHHHQQPQQQQQQQQSQGQQQHQQQQQQQTSSAEFDMLMSSLVNV